MVSCLSMVFMAVSALLSIGTPIALFLILRKKYGIKSTPALAGIVVFIVAVMVLESLVHKIVLHRDASGGITLMQQPFLYMLYGSLMAGFFEETARFAAFMWLKKKYSGIGTALSYGIGHGGIEAALLCGLNMIGCIALSFIINTGSMNVLNSGIAAGGGAAKITEAVSTLITTNPAMFLLAGAERIMAISIQISFSVIVWYAVNKERKLWLLPAAILLHALTDCPAALAQAKVLPVSVVEPSLLVFAAVNAYIAYFIHKKLKTQ